MKRLSLALPVLAAGLLLGAASAFASVSPALTLNPTGSGDQVQVNVVGDPGASVLLSYTQTGTGSTISNIGSTNSSGTFSTTLSSAALGIAPGTIVNVFIGGTSGPQSPSVAWPNVSGTSTLTLTPGAVVVPAGSSASVSAANLSGTLYVSSNSNPSIANVSVSGSTISVTGNTPGQTTAALCILGASGTCPTLFIVVEQAGAGLLSLAQTSATVVSGQNLPISISGGSGSYQIANNSNPTIISASLSGPVLTLATGATSGSAAITICTTDGALCNVVQASAGSASSVAVSFSTNAPVVSTGAATNVAIYGPTGVTYYVSSNSNPSIVQANLSGTTLSLTGIANGSATVSVCTSSGTCASLAVTVQYASNGANIALSQTQASLAPGQNVAITITGGQMPYSVSGGVSSVAQQSLANNVLTVYGIAGGTSSIQVCSAAGGCANLLVSVSGTPAATQPTTTTTTTTTPTPPATTFTENMSTGSQDAQVLALQQYLVSAGYMSVTPNGYYGPATTAAVIKFQAAHGIAQLGIVGPSTRAALNAAASAGSNSTAISSMTLAELQAQVQSLESQLAQLLSRIQQLSGQ